MDFDAFNEDPRTIAAVERKLLVISEAAIRLGKDAEVRCPGLPWGEIRGIGNWLRHQYDAVELSVVWKTVRDVDGSTDPAPQVEMATLRPDAVIRFARSAHRQHSPPAPSGLPDPT